MLVGRQSGCQGWQDSMLEGTKSLAAFVNPFRVINHDWQFQRRRIPTGITPLESLCQVNLKVGNSPDRRSNY
jgi:hypothetical protein